MRHSIKYILIVVITLFQINLAECDSPFLKDPQPLNYFVNGTNLQGNVSFYPAFFSFPMLATKSRPLLMVNSHDDPFACSTLNYKTTDDGIPFADNFILISVSPNPLCAISTQAQNALALGVAAIIMYGCSPKPPTNCDPNFLPVFGVVAIPVPVIYTRSFDGAILANYIHNNQPSVSPLITTIKGTNGPTLSVDKNAVISMANNTYSPASTQFLYVLFGLIGVQLSDTSKILNPSFDPCLSYLAGAWCENGRIVFLWAMYIGINGVLPKAFGQLSALRFIELGYNAITDISPLCNVHPIQYLGLESNQLGSLPDCFDGFPNFGTLFASNNKITNFPNSLLKVASSVVWINLDNNQVASFPSFSSFVNLRILSLGNNGGTGTISSFKNFQYLTTLNLQNNKFSGCIGSDYLDGLLAVQTIDLSSNNICGPLPNLVGSGSNLVSLSIQFNQFSSSIPTSWSGLSVLLTLKANNNRISSPVDTLSLLSTVTSIDLSYNFITAKTSDPLSDGKVGKLIGSSGGSSVTHLNLNNNLLAGAWSSGELTFALKSLSQLSVSNNYITTVPGDIFDPVFSPPNLISLDVSNNQISGPFPGPVVPSSSVAYLNFQGNPAFQDHLPSWAVFNYKSILLIDRFLCYSMASANNPLLTFLLDPGFANYAGCKCNNGYYGTPPNCLNIPSLISPVNTSTPGAVTASVNPNLVYSDAVYGDQRYSSGMDTSWEILPPFTGSTVRVITLTFNFYAAFHSVTDSLTISDRKGRVVGSVTGTGNSLEVMGTGLNGVYKQTNGTMVLLTVYDVGARINFKTIDTKGLHMDFTYTVDYKCPEDTGVSPSTNQCVKWFVVPDIYRFVVYIVSGFISLIILCVSAFVYKHRATLVIKSSSVPFCLLILFFMLLMAVGASFWAYQPSIDDSTVCHLRPWFLGVGVVGVLASLFAKANRIRLIFNNEKFKERVMSNGELLTVVGIMIAIQVILLIAYSASPFSKSEVIDGTGSTSLYLVKSCFSANESDSYLIWLVIQFAYVTVFLIAGLYIAFGIRNVPSAYNESSHIVNCLVCLLTLGVIVILIQFLIQDNPNASAILRGLGQAMVALVLTLSIFGPKIYNIVDGRGNDPGQVTRDTFFKKRSAPVPSDENKANYKTILTNLSDQLQKVSAGHLYKSDNGLANDQSFGPSPLPSPSNEPSHHQDGATTENNPLVIKEMLRLVNEAINKIIPTQPSTVSSSEYRQGSPNSPVRSPRSRPHAGSTPLQGVSVVQSDTEKSPMRGSYQYTMQTLHGQGSSTSNLQLATVNGQGTPERLARFSIKEQIPEGLSTEPQLKTINKI